MSQKDTKSKFRYENYDSVDREFLVSHVAKKLKSIVSSEHIYSVISILFEEIANDLLASKDIRIDNFGEFKLQILKGKRFYNRIKKEFDFSKESKLFRFTLTKKIKKFIINNLDIEKTFGSTYTK